MNTTKKCHFCKEDILQDATLCKHCGKKQPRVISKRVWQVLGVLFFIGALGAAFDDSPSSTSSTSSSPSQAVQAIDTVKVGENGHLSISGDGPVLVAINKEYYDEMFRLITVNDTLGLAKMTLDGKILLVDNGTAVKVIDSSFASRVVRINEGKYIGESGWVPKEMVIR